MSTPPSLCRLCVTVCKVSKSLYDENGLGTEIYDVTYKYFHPLILNMEECRHLTMLCLPCWRHICDFQDFQLSVQAAQAKLSLEVSGYVIKTEVEDLDRHGITVKVESQEENLPTSNSEEETVLGLINNKDVFKAEPELELIDVHEHNQPSSEEDWETEDDVIQMIRDKRKHSSSVTLDDRLAKWLPNINCVVCSESWPKYSLLREHFFQSHPKEYFYILCCNRKLSVQFQIDEHLRLHNNPDAFKCDHCDKSFAQKRSLKRHIATCRPKDFESRRGQGCHYNARRESPAKAQVVADDIPSTSNEALVGASTKKDLYSHDDYGRPPTGGTDKQVVDDDDADDYIQVCEICGQGFDDLPPLQSHMWDDHRRNPRYMCTKCNRSFKTARDLREHVAVTHDRKYIYACAFCPSTFRTISTISRHRKAKHPHQSNCKFYKLIE